MLRPVGEGKEARTKVTYRVLASAFHDTTRMRVADLLYPYIFAFRWGGSSSGKSSEYDPFVARTTALLRERLVGIKVLRVAREVRYFGEIRVIQEVPIIEVYVDYAAIDPLQVAALAPPWSPIPWHLLVLMEEAVRRGWAAFSQEEAEHLGVSWLDLVRDPALKTRLASLVQEFASQGYIPEALRRWVTVEEAKERWTALYRFYQDYDHFLVTNGPYRLKRGTERGVVLEVFRDLSYPLGIGTFDKYVFPPRALNLRVTQQRKVITLEAEVQKIEKVMRSYETVQEPLQHSSLLGVYQISAVASYLVVDAEGRVREAGTSQAGEGVDFAIHLPNPLPAGTYTLLVALYLNENYVTPEVHALQYRVKGDS